MNTKKTIIIAVLILLCLRLFSVFLFPITDNTEARYGQISRLVIELSDWITPHYDKDTPFLGKPPLSFWISATGFYLLGVNDFSPRLPILIIAILTLVLVYRFVSSNLGTQFAWKTILVLSGSFFFFVSSAVVQPDLVLAFCCCWAMMAFWQCINEPNNKFAYWQLSIALGLGFLAKGLAIGVYVIIPIIIWLTWKKCWLQFLKQYPWVSGIMILLVVTLPWIIAMELKNPGFIKYFILGENFQRFFEAEWSGDKYGKPKNQPIGMIIIFVFSGLLPWSLFGLVLFFKKRRKVIFSKLRENREFYTYLGTWSGVPTITLFFNANYIFPYAIPISIPLSILLTYLILDLKNKVLVSLSFIFPLLITATIIFATTSNAIHRYTQKYLIATFDEMCPEQDCQLIYIGYGRFSADYYSLKKPIKIKNSEKIASFLSPEKVDFIACRKNSYTSLPDSIKVKFKEVGEFKPLFLFMEE